MATTTDNQIAFAEQIEAGLIDAGYFDDATAVELLDAMSSNRVGLAAASTLTVTPADQGRIIAILSEWFLDNDLDPLDADVLLDILDAAEIAFVDDVDWADDAYQTYMRQIFERDEEEEADNWS